MRPLRVVPGALCFFALLACASSPPLARPAPAAGGLASDEILSLKPYVAGLRTLDIEVGGRTLPFILDTGGGISVLTLETARAVGCTPFGRGVGFRHDGRQIAVQYCDGVELRLGGRQTADRDVAVFDLATLLGDAPPVGGLLALSAFEGEVVTLDLAGGRLVRGPVSRFEALCSGASRMEVRASRQVGGAALDLFVAIESPRGRLWFELDSGSSGPTYIAPHAADLLGIELPAGETRTAALPVAGIGPVQLPLRRRDELIYDGLLSIAFLEQFVLTVDLDGMRACARLRAG
jgi:hypothetical protein